MICLYLLPVTDEEPDSDNETVPDDESDADYQPSRVSDDDEQKDKDVPKADVAAIVDDKEEEKNKNEVVDKKEDQDKIKGPTEVINQRKEGDDEDDLVIVDTADQSVEDDKQADKVVDPEKSEVKEDNKSSEGAQEDTQLGQQPGAAVQAQTDEIVEGARVESTKQHAIAGEADSPPTTTTRLENDTGASHPSQISGPPPPRPAGEINLEMFKYSTDVWYRAHRDIIELHKELFRADPAVYIKHCTPPWVESLPPPIPGDTAGSRPGLFSDSNGV